MKNWKKNAIAASVLVFVCAGIYLNWLYTQRENTPDLVSTLNGDKILNDSTLVMSDATDAAQAAAHEGLAAAASAGDYFAAVRLSRQESRDSSISLLQEAMAYPEGEENAAKTSEELENLVSTSLKEAQIESLVIAKGYTDCVAYMSEGGISVAVASPEGGLQKGDVALISDIVLSQSDYALKDIRVIEVK